MKLSIDVGEEPDIRIPAKGKMCVTQSKSKITVDLNCTCGRAADVTHIIPVNLMKFFGLEEEKK
jgi:hypothetical protein